MDFTTHPLSAGFVWPDSLTNSQLVSDLQQQYWNQQGFFLLEDCFDADLLATVRAEIDPLEAQQSEYLASIGGKQGISSADALTFTVHLVQRSALLKHFARHPVFVELCRCLLGNQARLYWDQAVYKKPGNPEEFPWHQDNGYTFVEPQTYLTCWVPLVDATIENGCPWVLPGVHRHGTLVHRLTPLGLQCLDAPEGAVAVPAKAGSVVVFSSLTPHRTGPNLTSEMRKAYILQYGHSDAVAINSAGERLPQDDPQRQFEIVVDGAAVV
jgi:ectoine hydroxylase-related dioxygenase (phytanoyl-CoA dioxygenase family)